MESGTKQPTVPRLRTAPVAAPKPPAAAPKVAATKPAAVRPSSPPSGKRRELKFVGKVEFAKLNTVKPNDWNPNHMTPTMRASVRRGLLEDGWIVSQSLLIWRTDENGRTKNVIIDGEHRWEIATELGFEEAPMVFLDGLTREEASQYTVKFIQKHGEPDLIEMTALVKSFNITDTVGAALDLGIDADSMTRMLAATDTSFLGTNQAASNVIEDPNASPDGYTLSFVFAKKEDKDRVLEVLDAMKQSTRSTALLKLAETMGTKAR